MKTFANLHSAPGIAERAAHLFNYLKEVTALRFVKICDCRNYDQLLWFNEIPREPECFCVSWGTSADPGDTWLEIRRSPEPACPPIPTHCKDWVSSASLLDSSQPPSLRERISAPNSPTAETTAPTHIDLTSCPDVQASWNQYLITKWEPWAKEHRRWSRIQQVYGKLFCIYQQQKRLGEIFELRLGLGLLSWQTPSGERVYRHLVVGQANVSFDSIRGILSVQGAAEGVKLSLEYDMLDPGDLPVVEQHQAVEHGIQATAETPWDRNRIEPLLRQWVQAMNQRGRYDDSLQAPNSATSVPQVTFAPALILRRRSARTLVKLLGDIAKNIEQGGEIPFGVRRLCEIVDDLPLEQEEVPPPERDQTRVLDTEIYFPLSANEEQRSVVRRLESSRGVLVQGPPGTGKSHTIANLICHLLAKGMRVLVTSQTPRALKVLQAKIPRELTPLCVSVLGNDALALKNMENSVLGITERHHDWDAGGKERNERAILRLEERLHTGRTRLAEIEIRLRHLREIESYRHSIAEGAYQGTAAAIARKLAAERSRHGWLADEIAESLSLPVPAASFPRLLQLFRRLVPERRSEITRPFPDPSSLPDVEAFLSLVQAEADAQQVCQAHASRTASFSCKTLMHCGRDERKKALETLASLTKVVGSVKRRPVPWIQKAVFDVLSDQTGPWRDLLDVTGSALPNLRERAQQAHERRVQLPAAIDRQKVVRDARDLHDHLAKGGNLGFLFIRSGIVRRTLYLVQQARVNGRLCADQDILAELIDYLELEAKVESLWASWSGIADREDGPIPRQVAGLEQCHEALEQVFGLMPVLESVKAAVAQLAGLPEPAWHEEAAVAALIADLEAAAALDSLADCQRAFNDLLHRLQVLGADPASHAITGDLLSAVQARDAKSFGAALQKVNALAEDRRLLEDRESLFQTVTQFAPRLASMVAAQPDEPTWDERLAQIDQAWNWKRANAWLSELERQRDADALENEAKQLQRFLQKTMAELAAAKAWSHCFRRLTEAQRQHLMAWTNAVRRIGRGTGVRAEIHRRNARQHMDECRGAIPAWIMPFYRVAETMAASPEAFDVVILDEASQSGPETLALLYLAKQCVVVGDDQQISPEAVGVQRNDVDLLADRLIADLPHRDALGVESSLFDQAVIRFGRRIVLREHFRCVPEIIRFSNDLCYSATPLIPLRQYPPERLEPILVRLVPGGYKEGGSQSARNRPEAEALIQAIVQCCQDHRYSCPRDDKHANGVLTFGVISLQGEEQAKLINRLLLERLTPEEIERREIVCGDAYAFQGDERDVIFLSMVAAPNERFAALVKESDKRRFNVAASRARDQIWLFHTVTLNELNPDDMRYKLLAYLSDPGAHAAGEPDWEKCESEFEREVGKLIHSRHYRVIPQYEPFGPNSYRIDFVVEGLKSRLAIECDGPHHEDPQQIEQDMIRQRQLERCGWQFWRVSGSSFYFDREAAMASLWQRLNDLEIQPVTSDPSLQPAKSPSTPPEPPEPPEASVGPLLRSACTRPASQLELVPVPQLELTQSVKPNGSSSPSVFLPRCDLMAAETVVARLKSSRDNGFFTRDEICEVVLASLAPGEQTPRDELVRKVVAELGLPEHHGKRVENALEALESQGKVSAGVFFICRI